MHADAVRLLFLKDLYLSRKPLFAYFVAGVLSTLVTATPYESLSFIGFILVITVAIASGMHLLGHLMLAEATDQTRLFVMSLPVSRAEYSIAKIAVVMTTYLIPWLTMLACLTILSVATPGAKVGIVAVLPTIFLCLLALFTIQLVTAVVSESIGWTICVLVGCNVFLNLFLKTIYSVPAIEAAAQSAVLVWPKEIVQLLGIEILVIAIALTLAIVAQLRKRDMA